MRYLWSLSLVWLLVGCSSSGPVHPPTLLEPFAQTVKVNAVWKKRLDSSDLDQVYADLTPVISGSRIYSVAAEGVITALEIERGRAVWEVTLESPLSGGLALNDELLFVGTAEAELLALNKHDGQEVWRAALSSEPLAPPVATESIVIIRTGDGKVYGFNPENGQRLWQVERTVPVLTLRGESRPVLSDELVLVGFPSGRLMAISLYDGSVRWEVAVATPKGRSDLERMVDVDATPLIDRGVVYAASHQGRIVALSLETGSLLWERELSSSAGMTLDSQVLYVTDDEGQVWALDRKSGASLWKQEKLKYRQVTAPRLLDESLVVGDFEGYLHWLSREDGHLMSRYRVSKAAIRVAPLYVDKVLYVRSEGGDLEALTTAPVKK